MSNFLAVATVTATLQQSLQTVVEKAVAGATVKTLRPDMPGNGTPDAHVNLYLYQVTPNAAWRNADIPTRDSRGTLVSRPQVALDLHYLLSFYGDEAKLEPQRLLGSVTQAFHSHPLLTRQSIRSTIVSPTYNYLAKSNLAEEIELVKFTPTALTLEELSKLWSVFFQTQYALSVAYHGTVVLIEDDKLLPQSALPVHQRQIHVAPFRVPVIEEVMSLEGPNEPIVEGTTLVIRGKRLSGAVTQLRLGGTGPLPVMAISNDELRVLLSEPPLPVNTLRAGVQGVQVVHSPAVPARRIESNVAPFVLRPRILSVTPSAGPPRTVSVKVKPIVTQSQRAVLLLNEPDESSPGAYSIVASLRTTDTDLLSFDMKDVPAGNYLVRVQIDGAESPLGVNAAGKFDSPQVTIP